MRFSRSLRWDEDENGTPDGMDGMKRAHLDSLLQDEWPSIIVKAAMPHAMGALPAHPKLLGSGFKTEKGEDAQGVLTGICYMAPASSGTGDKRTLCPFSTEGCRATCLGEHSGQMVMGPQEQARLWKTALYLGRRLRWAQLLNLDIHSLKGRAARRGLTPAVRIDGSSDTGTGRYAAKAHPDVTFYDYTKVFKFAWRQLTDPVPNYHVTLSYSGTTASRLQCVTFLNAGGNVAVVFDTPRGQPLPDEWEGFEVIDGDEHDARFMDGASKVVGLRFKTARKRAAMLAKAGSFVERV